jgi:DNA-binding MarR family transcriptional regulator
MKRPADSAKRPSAARLGEPGRAEDTIGHLARDVHRAFSRQLQAKIAAHGVSIGQWFFLLVLWERDGLTQRELSQRVGMMEPTTVTALNGMERRGLVERVRNAHDRRKMNIYLTAKGRGLREALLRCAHEVDLLARRAIDPGDIAKAMSVLARVMANLNSDPG